MPSIIKWAPDHSTVIFFPRVILFTFFSHFWSFMVAWGFGVGVLGQVCWVGVFSWGIGPVVGGLLGFLGWGFLYKYKRITMGKLATQPGLKSEAFDWPYRFY